MRKFINYLSKPFLFAVLLICWTTPTWSQSIPEYQLKAAFLYNFTTFTTWPEEVGKTLNICVYDMDPFGRHLDDLHGKKAGDRDLTIQRVIEQKRLRDCHVVFITQSVGDMLPGVLEMLKGEPVLTVSDTPNATNKGVALNMVLEKNRVTFEANLVAVRDNGLRLSSRLLRLAREVIQ